MNHNKTWLSCKNAGRYQQSNKLFLETLSLVLVVKHWSISCWSQSSSLWGYGWNEMHEVKGKLWTKLEPKYVFGQKGLWAEMFLDQTKSSEGCFQARIKFAFASMIGWTLVARNQDQRHTYLAPLFMWLILWGVLAPPINLFCGITLDIKYLKMSAKPLVGVGVGV